MDKEYSKVEKELIKEILNEIVDKVAKDFKPEKSHLVIGYYCKTFGHMLDDSSSIELNYCHKPECHYCSKMWGALNNS